MAPANTGRKHAHVPRQNDIVHVVLIKQFDHPLVRRAKLEISAACHAHGKVPSHNVSTEVRDMDVVANDALRVEP